MTTKHLKNRCPVDESLKSFARSVLRRGANPNDSDVVKKLHGAAQQWVSKKHLTMGRSGI
jgi:hypothetical protein